MEATCIVLRLISEPGFRWLQIKIIFLGEHVPTPHAFHACLTCIFLIYTLCHPCCSTYGHIFSHLVYAAFQLLPIPIDSYQDYDDAYQLLYEGDSI